MRRSTQWLYGSITSISAIVACEGSRRATEPTTGVDSGVSKLQLVPDTATLAIGTTLRIAATALGSNGHSIAGASIHWIVADTSIADVDAGGVVKGKRGGVTQILASTANVVGRGTVRILFPNRDSTVVKATDTTVLHVGFGSTVRVAPGALPSGTAIGASVGTSMRLDGDSLLTVSVSPNNSVSGLRAFSSRTLGSGSIALEIVKSGSATTMSALGRVDVALNDAAGRTIAVFPSETVADVPAAGLVRTTVTVPVSLLSSATIGGTSLGISASIQSTPTTCSSTGSSKLQSTRSDVSPQRIAVVLIHGWQMTQHDCAAVESYDPASSTWRYVLGGLPPTSVDYDVYTFRYPSFQHIKQSAADLARAIQAQLSGRDVIMIAHSMGGLVAASYMNTDPAEHVQHLITLGTPWNGSVLANNISVSVTAAHNCVFEDSYYSESEKNLAALAAVYDWAKATSDGSDDLAPSSIFFKSLTPSAIQSLSSRITAITGDVRTSFRSPPIVAHAFSVTMPCTLKRLGAQSGGDAIVPTESSNNGGLLSVSSSLGFDHALLTDDFVDQGNPTPFDPLPKVVKKLSSLRLDVMPVSTVQAHVSKSNLSIGETATLSANLLDYQGRAVTPRAISWSVSPPGVVTLNGAQGTLTAITGGSATITAAVNSYKGGGGTTKAHQLTISVSEGTPKLVLGQAALSSSITTGQSAPLQVVNVTNGGSGTLSGLSIGTITYGQNQQAGWFSAALTSTTAPTTISVTYATTTLPAGTYTASVPVLSSTSGVQNSPALDGRPSKRRSARTKQHVSHIRSYHRCKYSQCPNDPNFQCREWRAERVECCDILPSGTAKRLVDGVIKSNECAGSACSSRYPDKPSHRRISCDGRNQRLSGNRRLPTKCDCRFECD